MPVAGEEPEPRRPLHRVPPDPSSARTISRSHFTNALCAAAPQVPAQTAKAAPHPLSAAARVKLPVRATARAGN